MPRVDIQRYVHGSDRPCLALDEESRIISWNQPLSWLLGFEEKEVVHRDLGRVLHLRDVFGNRWCSNLCPIHEMVRAGEPVRPFDADFRKETGEYVRMRVHVTALLPSAGSGYQIVLGLEEVRRRRTSDRGREDPAPGADAPSARDSAERPDLTRRQVQTLRLLVRGLPTRKIAAELGITEGTARKHVQSVLKKLDVDNRTAAVAAALKNRLV